MLACSALKESYRQILTPSNASIQWVYLKGSYNLIQARMTARKGHYMKPEMLQSQFAALEEPENALVIDIQNSVHAIVEKIISNMNSSNVLF